MKAGVKLSEALDLTREWLSGIDSTEDDMEINPTVLAELEERSKAMRRELEGKVTFSLLAYPALLLVEWGYCYYKY